MSMRQGPQFYQPRTNPDGLDYYSGDRRTPVPLLEIPEGVTIQVLPPGPSPDWAGYVWPEVRDSGLYSAVYDPTLEQITPGARRKVAQLGYGRAPDER